VIFVDRVSLDRMAVLGPFENFGRKSTDRVPGPIKFAGSGSMIVNQGGTDTLTDTGSNNTIALPPAGQGLDTINGSVLTNGDTFDLRATLAATTWDQQLSDGANYLTLGTLGANALVQISTTSGGTPLTVAVLNGQGAVSLSAFIAHALLT